MYVRRRGEQERQRGIGRGGSDGKLPYGVDIYVHMYMG